MLGHYHVPGNIKAIPFARSFEADNKLIAGRRGVQQTLTMVAAECYEVQLSSLLKALQPPRHWTKLQLASRSLM